MTERPWLPAVLLGYAPADTTDRRPWHLSCSQRIRIVSGFRTAADGDHLGCGEVSWVPQLALLLKGALLLDHHTAAGSLGEEVGSQRLGCCQTRVVWACPGLKPAWRMLPLTTEGAMSTRYLCQSSIMQMLMP